MDENKSLNSEAFGGLTSRHSVQCYSPNMLVYLILHGSVLGHFLFFGTKKFDATFM